MQIIILHFCFKTGKRPGLCLIHPASRIGHIVGAQWICWMNGKSCLQGGKFLDLRIIKLELRWNKTSLSLLYPSPNRSASSLNTFLTTMNDFWLHIPLWLWHKNPPVIRTLCVVQQPGPTSVSRQLSITTFTQKGVGDACVPCHPHANCQGQGEYFHSACLPFLFSFKLLLVIKAEANWNWQLCGLQAIGKVLEIMWTTLLKT